MAKKPKDKKKDQQQARRKPAPKAPDKGGRELSEEDLSKVAGGGSFQWGIGR
jgi:hypothetical protein